MPPNATNVFSIQRELQAMDDPLKRSMCEERLAMIDDCLQKSSPFRLRDDSRLAFRFAEAHGAIPKDWTVWHVAHEIACMQFFCTVAPDYQGLQQDFLRSLANEVRSQTGVEWKQLWSTLAEWGPEVLKLHLMAERKIMMPNFASSC